MFSLELFTKKCSHNLKVLQEGGPFQGPKLGSCLTLGNELSEETHVPTKHMALSPAGESGTIDGF